jgi:hypothetical protein
MREKILFIGAGAIGSYLGAIPGSGWTLDDPRERRKRQ